MTQKELDKIIYKHQLWLIDEKGGERANLCYKDISNLNMSHCDLSGAKMRGATLLHCDMEYCDLRDCDMRGSLIIYCNMICCDIRGADMEGANIDYSCLPLWCGSLTAHFDDRQLRQIAYHLVKAGLNSKNASEETKYELAKLIDFANGFRRARECGMIKHMEEETNARQT